MPMMNLLADLVVGLTGKMSFPYTDYANIIELYKHQTYQLEAHTQIVRVLSGCAWITISGKDQIVPAGEDVLLTPGKENPIISSVISTPLAFEIQSV
jgi:hypothetical protein